MLKLTALGHCELTKGTSSPAGPSHSKFVTKPSVLVLPDVESTTKGHFQGRRKS